MDQMVSRDLSSISFVVLIFLYFVVLCVLQLSDLYPNSITY